MLHSFNHKCKLIKAFKKCLFVKKITKMLNLQRLFVLNIFSKQFSVKLIIIVCIINTCYYNESLFKSQSTSQEEMFHFG